MTAGGWFVSLVALGIVIWGGWAIVRFTSGRPCPKCGRRVHAGDVKCGSCGHSFLADGEVQVRQLRALDPPADVSEGWKADPMKPEQLRWWDGQEWQPKVGIRRQAEG